MNPNETPSPNSPLTRESAATKTNQSTERDFTAIANGYARAIIAGELPACKRTVQACERHFRDLDRAAHGDVTFPYVWNAESAARACKFIEALPHIKGKWLARRELIHLEDWQVFFVGSVFGWVEREDPALYRFHECALIVPRGNGKSTLDAGIALYKFCADGEAGAEVYFGATSREQAMDVGFTPAMAMAERSPALLKAFGIRVNKKSLRKLNDVAAVMKPIIAKPGDGARPSFASIEEYHEHKTDFLVDAMRTGMAGGRDNPLLALISTAGVDMSVPFHALQQDYEKLLAGTTTDDRTFVVIYGVDEDDDWKSLAAHIKANPNWGISVNPRKVLAGLQAAINSPRKQSIHKTKHLNIWVNAAVSWLNSEEWKACADADLDLEDFSGEECYLSLDLADRKDLVAKVLCFKKQIDGKWHFYLFAKHYLNQQAIDDASTDNFRQWAAEGFLTATTGNVTDYPQIADDVVEDTKKFVVKEIPHDPHHASPLVQFIQDREDWDQHIECVAVTPNVAFFSPAMMEFEAAVLERRIHHNGDPVLAWEFSNVTCRKNRRDLLFPDKQNAKSKIDGAVASLMGFGRANVTEPEQYTSPRVFSV